MKTWKEASLRKICPPNAIEELCTNLRVAGKTLATLNGSFDLLHAGHLQILFEASQMGQILIVALNSDESIKQYKNPRRPFIPLQYRLELIAALAFVDFVTWFNETDPCLILSKMKPDVHVNGAEYGENCIEAEVVKSNGGRIHIVPLIAGLSTTQIVQKITAAH